MSSEIDWRIRITGLATPLLGGAHGAAMALGVGAWRPAGTRPQLFRGDDFLRPDGVEQRTPILLGKRGCLDCARAKARSGGVSLSYRELDVATSAPEIARLIEQPDVVAAPLPGTTEAALVGLDADTWAQLLYVAAD
jgi:hypothetical protein